MTGEDEHRGVLTRLRAAPAAWCRLAAAAHLAMAPHHRHCLRRIASGRAMELANPRFGGGHGADDEPVFRRGCTLDERRGRRCARRAARIRDAVPQSGGAHPARPRPWSSARISRRSRTWRVSPARRTKRSRPGSRRSKRRLARRASPARPSARGPPVRSIPARSDADVAVTAAPSLFFTTCAAISAATAACTAAPLEAAAGIPRISRLKTRIPSWRPSI